MKYFTVNFQLILLKHGLIHQSYKLHTDFNQ
jgi:hypothetical protein